MLFVYRTLSKTISALAIFCFSFFDARVLWLHAVCAPWCKSIACRCLTFQCFHFLLSDDPYYCGLRARVPNFVKSSKSKSKDQAAPMKRISVSNLQHPAASLASLHQLHQMHPHHQHLYASSHAHSSQYLPHHMLHTRSFESGIGEYFSLHIDGFTAQFHFNDEQFFICRFGYDWVTV